MYMISLTKWKWSNPELIVNRIASVISALSFDSLFFLPTFTNTLGKEFCVFWSEVITLPECIYMFYMDLVIGNGMDI